MGEECERRQELRLLTAPATLPWPGHLCHPDRPHPTPPRLPHRLHEHTGTGQPPASPQDTDTGVSHPGTGGLGPGLPQAAGSQPLLSPSLGCLHRRPPTTQTQPPPARPPPGGRPELGGGRPGPHLVALQLGRTSRFLADSGRMPSGFATWEERSVVQRVPVTKVRGAWSGPRRGCREGACCSLAGQSDWCEEGRRPQAGHLGVWVTPSQGRRAGAGHQGHRY